MKQVLRMSMRMSMQVNTLKQEPGGVVFGVPSETGWSIAKPSRMTQDTRLNVMLTYDMCRMPRPSMLIFEPEPDELDVPGPEDLSQEEDDLGNLLGRLAGLNSYFKEAGAEPSEEALHRAQAILSKSSHPELVPETPLADQLFDVAPPSPRSYIFGDSDEEESEGEEGVSDAEDSFAFDRKSRFFARQNRPTMVAV
jgi:furry protein family